MLDYTLPGSSTRTFPNHYNISTRGMRKPFFTIQYFNTTQNQRSLPLHKNGYLIQVIDVLSPMRLSSAPIFGEAYWRHQLTDGQQTRENQSEHFLIRQASSFPNNISKAEDAERLYPVAASTDIALLYSSTVCKWCRKLKFITSQYPNIQLSRSETSDAYRISSAYVYY